MLCLASGYEDHIAVPLVGEIRRVQKHPGHEAVFRNSGLECTKQVKRKPWRKGRNGCALAGHGHPPMPYHIYKLFFLCALCGGVPVDSVETSDVGFFAEDELPPLSLSRVTTVQVKHMFDHYRNHEWPTSFD